MPMKCCKALGCRAGVRRQDLIRHGKFVEYARRRGINAQPHHVLFPIPLFVIEQGGGVIEQNPGY